MACHENDVIAVDEYHSKSLVDKNSELLSHLVCVKVSEFFQAACNRSPVSYFWRIEKGFAGDWVLK